MGKHLTWLLSFVLGTVILCFFSTLQKIGQGYPLTWEGYIVPFLFGGCISLLAGMHHYRVREVKNDLQKAHDDLEIQVIERTTLLETNWV